MARSSSQKLHRASTWNGHLDKFCDSKEGLKFRYNTCVSTLCVKGMGTQAIIVDTVSLHIQRRALQLRGIELLHTGPEW